MVILPLPSCHSCYLALSLCVSPAWSVAASPPSGLGRQCQSSHFSCCFFFFFSSAKWSFVASALLCLLPIPTATLVRISSSRITYTGASEHFLTQQGLRTRWCPSCWQQWPGCSLRAHRVDSFTAVKKQCSVWSPEARGHPSQTAAVEHLTESVIVLVFRE